MEAATTRPLVLFGPGSADATHGTGDRRGELQMHRACQRASRGISHCRALLSVLANWFPHTRFDYANRGPACRHLDDRAIRDSTYHICIYVFVRVYIYIYIYICIYNQPKTTRASYLPVMTKFYRRVLNHTCYRRRYVTCFSKGKKTFKAKLCVRTCRIRD